MNMSLHIGFYSIRSPLNTLDFNPLNRCYQELGFYAEMSSKSKKFRCVRCLKRLVHFVDSFTHRYNEFAVCGKDTNEKISTTKIRNFKIRNNGKYMDVLTIRI